MPDGDASFEEVMQRIERKLDQHGMTEREASLKAVGKPDLIRDMKRRRGLPTSQRLAKLATLLETTTDWLLHGGMEGPILDRSLLNRDGTVRAIAPGGAAAEDVHAQWLGGGAHKPVPLIGTAFGGEWAAEIEMTELHFQQVVDLIGRPPGLQNDRESYAIEIVGDSMAPRLEPGERIFISPLSPVRIGDDVVVQLTGDAAKALIKRLVRQSPDSLELRQFNPDRTFSVPVAQVAAIHRVKGRL